MSAEQKIFHGRAPLMFAGLPNNSALLTMFEQGDMLLVPTEHFKCIKQTFLSFLRVIFQPQRSSHWTHPGLIL